MKRGVGLVVACRAPESMETISILLTNVPCKLEHLADMQGAGILKHSHNEYVWYAQGGGELVSILPPAFRKTAFPQKHPQRKYMFYAH
eukprot:scaffold58650_cov15-Tisochrysis_lutea.AAC.1